MKDGLIQRMFRNETKAFIAVQMDDVLENVVHAGFRLSKKKGIEQDIIAEALEGKAAPLIREILNSINLEVSGNIQGMDERVIWRIYWDLRNNSVDMNVSIFELLRELNNPSPIFA